MKIFQVGLNRCQDTEYLNHFCVDHGHKCIRWDGGKLMESMHKNRENNQPILSGGYEFYDFYADMESMVCGLTITIQDVKLLEKQHPDSVFILNRGKVEDWLDERLRQDKSFLRLSMSMTKTCSREEMIHAWKGNWEKYVRDIQEHFKNRPHKLLLFDNYVHPMELYLFLNPIDHVINHFEYMYRRDYHRRIQDMSSSSTTTMGEDCPVISITNVCDIYCPFVLPRESYIRTTLSRFPNVHFVEAITPDDLRKKQYQKLSTTCMPGPEETHCLVCKDMPTHKNIYNKFTKLCVHLSYLICMRHALENGQKDCVLIFEDDIYFDCTDSEFVQHIAEFSKSDFDVCYLGFCACRNGDAFIRNQQGDSLLVALPHQHSIRCKHAIVYKRAYIERALGLLLPLLHNSDIQLNHANIQAGAKVAMARRPIVFQDRIGLGSFNDNDPIDSVVDNSLRLYM